MSNNGSSVRFGGPTQYIGKAGPIIAVVSIVSILFVAGLSRVGCVNLHTPPGHEGYLRSKPLIGAGEFEGIQRGPTSTGWVWRQEVINIDMRPRTYSEEMTIRTSKGSELSFRAHARIQLAEGGVRDIVEKLGGADWYSANVQKTFQRAVREQVQTLEPFEVKSQSDAIAEEVLAQLKREYVDRPIRFISVHIGDIQYPETIVESVIKKRVTSEENERKDVERQIAQRQIEIGVIEAEGIAVAQRIIRKTLNPMFLQYEALGAIEQLAGSPDTTFVVVPYSANGAAPIIMNMDN